jgi:hypothetical protein
MAGEGLETKTCAVHLPSSVLELDEESVVADGFEGTDERPC